MSPEKDELAKTIGVQGTVTVVPIKKAVDDRYRQGTVTSNVLEKEDEFADFYIGSTRDANILQPPYDLKTLARFVLENNALAQCVAAMEVNVDGTGYGFDRTDGTPIAGKDAEVKSMFEFFAETYPGVSFITLRRDLRWDEESTGNAYLEIIRNPKDEIVFLRRADPTMMRIVKLGEPHITTKSVIRNGQKVSVKITTRERVFAQLIGTRVIYFKEYGASRDLDKTNGKWAEEGQRLPANKRATEILHKKCISDVSTPYGVPRWIPQVPSVIGSRKAEVFNLDFFDNGGVPPMIIFLTNGSLDKQNERNIQNILKSGNKTKARGAVVSISATGGSIDKPAQASVQVERFGSEKQKDSMFENYDLKCEIRTRSAFRLPPLFVGRVEGNNFATAYVSYLIAEAQVFAPERKEFDELMNLTIMKEIGAGKFKLRSLPMSVKNMEAQIKALGLAKNVITGEEMVKAVNEIGNLNLKFKAPAGGDFVGAASDQKVLNEKNPGAGAIESPAAASAKVTSPEKIVKGADDETIVTAETN